MNILLVSDAEDYIKDLEKRLVFLRNDDKILSVSYSDALTEVTLSNASIVLVHEGEPKKTLNLIKKLNAFENLCTIFIAETPDLILKASDIGIDDYIMSDAPDYEFVLRIVNNIKLNSLKLINLRNEKLLAQHKLLDELSGFYTCSKNVIENAIDKDLITKGIFMALSPSDGSKTNYSYEGFANALKKSTRSGDIIASGQGVNVYIFMPNTDFNGSLVVLNKIKDNIKFEICAGIADIAGKIYDVFENEAIKALAEALATNADYVFAQKEEKTEEWLNDDVKNYKLFRKMYSKKLEKEITPVFFRLQKAYEEKLFATEIEQYITEEQCVFKLKNKKFNGTLNIIYPGFAKIIIDIIYDGLDSPENKEIQLPLSKVDQSEIGDIVEDFIKEFKSYAV